MEGSPAGASRTPTAGTAGHKRSREQPAAAAAEEQPLAALLEQIRRLKLPSLCDAATANRLLAPFVQEALRLDERGTLLAIVQQFGWEGGSGEFSKAIDLGSLSLLLQVRGCGCPDGCVWALTGRGHPRARNTHTHTHGPAWVISTLGQTAQARPAPAAAPRAPAY